MRLLEHYTSIQGEGPNTGLPIQFVRFAGCNMKCPGWPCDTPQAIFPKEFSGKFEDITPEEIVLRCQHYPRRVCLTGGEPFLQPNMGHLINLFIEQGFDVDIFTNGSFPIPERYTKHSFVTIIMDWKLEGSGEADTNRHERIENIKRLNIFDAVKFVVKDQDDLQEALAVWEDLKLWSCRAKIYVGAAWGHISDADIVDFIVANQLPWILNVQLHKHIWDPEARYT
jgi:7-carboxy-7-deazaguanine synthase